MLTNYLTEKNPYKSNNKTNMYPLYFSTQPQYTKLDNYFVLPHRAVCSPEMLHDTLHVLLVQIQNEF